MTDSRFAVPLADLEAVRIEAADLVEETEREPAPAPDPRGGQPDRDWFAAGG